MPSKIFQNWDFWFENIPSGNPASQYDSMKKFHLDRNYKQYTEVFGILLMS
jgi:hypothetical protein